MDALRAVQAGMAESTEVVQGDFCKMPFADNSFDAVFSVEATCHAGQVRSCTECRAHLL